ncbi:hypothetical protein Adt_43500 [Abeliophyllum distichum]|uniref:Uncharacterized protein n=1 Tax=Abeliophyllum distichum TaxID=126358 RepID=A0ABD1P878_9LAMI
MPIRILPHHSDEASEAIGTSNKNQISKRNNFMHGPSSIIICEAPLTKLIINPSARRTQPLMENTTSFRSRISELLPTFTKDEDGIKGVGRKKPKLLNLFA